MSKKVFDPQSLKDEISKGIDTYMRKHGFSSDYKAGVSAGINDNSIGAIRNTGGCTAQTLLRLGIGAGYNGNNLNIMIRVLQDFKGIDHGVKSTKSKPLKEDKETTHSEDELITHEFLGTNND